MVKGAVLRARLRREQGQSPRWQGVGSFLGRPANFGQTGAADRRPQRLNPSCCRSALACAKQRQRDAEARLDRLPSCCRAGRRLGSPRPRRHNSLRIGHCGGRSRPQSSLNCASFTQQPFSRAPAAGVLRVASAPATPQRRVSPQTGARVTKGPGAPQLSVRQRPRQFAHRPPRRSRMA
jgi:hypothetical protein